MLPQKATKLFSEKQYRMLKTESFMGNWVNSNAMVGIICIYTSIVAS